MPVSRRSGQEKLIFASTVFPSKSSETNTLLMAESIRAFAQSLAHAPIWLFTSETQKQLSNAFRERLLALDVSLIPFRINREILGFPLVGDVSPAALAESKAANQAELLAWLGGNTLVIQKLKELLLPSNKTLGFRPVHHTLIGSRYDEPLDPFWTLIYRYCNVPETRVFPMMTHVDGTRIRPYFNAGLLVTRPVRRLLQGWHLFRSSIRRMSVTLFSFTKLCFQGSFCRCYRLAKSKNCLRHTITPCTCTHKTSPIIVPPL